MNVRIANIMKNSGKPSRPIKCMGYEPKEAAVEEQNIERHKANKTQKV